MAAAVEADSGKVEITEISVGKVKTGMIILDDVRTHMGVLLVPKGFEVTDVFIERMRNFGPGILFGEDSGIGTVRPDTPQRAVTGVVSEEFKVALCRAPAYFSSRTTRDADSEAGGRVYNMRYPMSGGYVWRAV